MNIFLTYHYLIEDKKDIFKWSSFAYWQAVMIYPKWLELPMSRTHLCGLKIIRTIEVHL